MADEKDSATPRPKKRRRGLITLGLCLLLLLAAWGVARLWSDSALDREIAAIRARGEPVSLAEMAPKKALPPDQDAAVLVRRAVRIYDANVAPLLRSLEVQLAAAGWSYENNGSRVGITSTDVVNDANLLASLGPQLAGIRDAAGPMLDLLRKARGLESYDLGVDLSKPSVQIWSNLGLTKAREVARCLGLLAVEAHRRGDDAEALECLRDLFLLARQVRQVPLMITELVATAIESLTDWVGGMILPELKIGPGAGAARSEDARAFAAMLLDPNRANESLLRTMRGEQAYNCSAMGAVVAGELPQAELDAYDNAAVSNGALRAVLHPVIGADAAASIRESSSLVEAARRANYFSALAAIAPQPAAGSRFGKLLRPFTGMGGAHDHFLLIRFRSEASLRMAGLTIAIRMYELDRGRKIERLEQLVPDYLPALPKDPFDASGGSIRLGRWGGRELLYSVGNAGKDMGGQYAADANWDRPWGTDEYNWSYFLRGDGGRAKLVQRTPPTAATTASAPAQ